MLNIKETILAQLKDDYVGLWEIIKEIEIVLDAFDATCPKNTYNGTDLRWELMVVIKDLLESGVQAGTLLGDGGFKPFDLTNEQILEKINREWNEFEKVSIGDIAWFNKD
jgi:hypothetical protein